MKRILVATDLSPKAGPAIQRACRIASEQCAALLILHVIAGSLPAVDRAILAEMKAKHDQLADKVRSLCGA